MNYFIDIPTFSRFYTLNDDEDDEKPPPDLKSTGERTAEVEERKIKKGKRRIETTESAKTSPTDETMGSASRKEKSSLWPDWQFWKRNPNDSSGGPFGAFRKSTKTTGSGFTFRKDINTDSIRVNKPEMKTEHALTDFANAINVGQTYSGESKRSPSNVQDQSVVRDSVRVSELEKDGGPLVSYKNESNGSKHVVINMAKVETLAGRKNGNFSLTSGDVGLGNASDTMEEKYSTATLPAQHQTYSALSAGASAKTLINVNDVKLEETSKRSSEVNKTSAEAKVFVKSLVGQPQNDGIQARNYESSCNKNNSATVSAVNPAQAMEQKTLEVQRKGNGSPTPNKAIKHVGVEIQPPLPKAASPIPVASKQSARARHVANRESSKKTDPKGCFKTIKNSVIPLPSINAKQVAEKKEARDLNDATAKGACLEQGRLHNVLKKVTETWRPGSSNSIAAQPHECPTTATVQTKVLPPVQATDSPVVEIKPANVPIAVYQQPEIQPLVVAPRPENGDASKKQPIASGSVLKPRAQVNVSQKATAVARRSVRMQRTGKVPPVNDQATFGIPVRVVNDQTKQTRQRNISTPVLVKRPIMKDASTTTPTPRATVDAQVQVPSEDSWENGLLDTLGIDSCDETESLLKKRPWDTERVLKMQVLLDEKEVEIGQLKDAGRRQREELRASRKRCVQLEDVIEQASMEGKPQLVIEINELTEFKNELLTEVTKLTVDIERERTNVKVLKTELVEVKSQLSAARKKNGTFVNQ